MAKRFIDTDMFRKPLVRSLKAPYKVLWVYLLCECDHAGVWNVEFDVANMRLGIKIDPEKAVSEMNGAVVSVDGGRRWWIPEFVSFQYGRLNPANKVHASVLAILSKYNIDPNNQAPWEPLGSPLGGAKDMDKDKEQEGGNAEEQGRASFETAWEAYGRYGNKLPASHAWGKLTPADRAACMMVLPAYVLATSTDGSFPSRKHFSSYLNARAWEDAIPVRPAANGASVPHVATSLEDWNPRG